MKNTTEYKFTAIIRFLLLIIFTLFLSNLSAQTTGVDSLKIESFIKRVENTLIPPKSDSSQVTWSISERMEFYKIPAVSVAIIDNYQLNWAKAYGWADKEAKIPATTETLFQAASISKSLNSVGILNWAESNNIDLNTDINTYLKSWKLKNRKKAKGKEISISNLLSHTAGLSGHGFNGYKVGEQIPTTEQILDGKKPSNSKKIKSISQPNKVFKYSGSGVMITQLMLSQNTGIAYSTYMKKTILNPLGMTESFFSQPSPKDKGLATAYWAQGTPLDGKYHIYPEMAAAGLWTNPTELSKYIIEMQKSLKGESNILLSQEMAKKMLSPHLKDGITGLGVFFENLNGRDYFTHGGSNEGFKCYYYGSIEDGKGIVIMTNSENFDIIPEIIRSIIKVYEW
jgi:CubicO group peptidase (beta-lactamase class C family)